ncbi:unnamed protein product [Prorocentrum cordatum]|uniref:Subtilisin n=1 Tax=Prorocentrum cordatum TaxID=2364126 RepID=A0ABN9QRC9_9DINO|nr:unnamed protein product [Polarella glacialis]CAK0808782.1 unnamed protein product [Polarella glacialis]
MRRRIASSVSKTMRVLCWSPGVPTPSVSRACHASISEGTIADPAPPRLGNHGSPPSPPCRPIYETTAILAVGAEAGHLSTSSLRQRIRCASISSRQPLCHRSLDCASTQNLELMVGVPKYSTDASNNGAGDILGIRRESERERGRER